MSNKSGLLFIISSPSGAGKTTLCQSLRKKFPELGFSVSYTTRAPRIGEIDGINYHFVDNQTFDRMISEKAFAEWAFIHGKRYGTTVQSVKMVLELGNHILFDIDFQGAENLRAQFPKESRLIYILPPSLETLATRLRSRATESQEQVERRLAKAKEELRHYLSYEYIVCNDQMDQALLELSAIYVSECFAAQGKHDPNDSMVKLAADCKTSHRGHLVEALLQEEFT